MLEKTILIVDDEENICELLNYNLIKNGYNPISTANGLAALEIIKTSHPDLILLDIMLPGIDGLDLCKLLKKDSSLSKIPIIMLSAKNEELDKVLCFELGADDYIVKPFSVREVMSRIKVILKRISYIPEDSIYKFSDIYINFPKHQVFKNNVNIDLTIKEFQILQLLIKSNGRVITRNVLLDEIWSCYYLGETRTIDVHIRHLRQKLEIDPKNPVFLETVRGIGYRFNSSSKSKF